MLLADAVSCKRDFGEQQIEEKKVNTETKLILNTTEIHTTSIGFTKTFIATLMPANTPAENVTWSSSNPAVASISSKGIMTTLTIGSAKITTVASADDGGK